MKANELRIGCNFQLENGVLGGGTATIKNKYDLDVAFDLLESNLIKPIPLTEEWLLKFGFKKSNVYCFGNHKLIIESLMGDRHSCRYRINPNESIWISELHYVHQLQNLYFALTGEELTFKSESFCNCPKGKGIDFDENQKAYCIDCGKNIIH